MKNQLILFFFLVPLLAVSQTDEIAITASFKSVIDLRIVGPANVYFEFNTVEDYVHGLDEFHNNYVQFEVGSTTNFELEFDHSDFVDEVGNILDSRYFYFRLQYLSGVEYVGERFFYGLGDGLPTGDPSLSNVFVLENLPKLLIEPGPEGNRGYYDSNYYEMQFGCGTYPVRALSGLLNLIDANISPGTYTSTLTLTAFPTL